MGNQSELQYNVYISVMEKWPQCLLNSENDTLNSYWDTEEDPQRIKHLISRDLLGE